MMKNNRGLTQHASAKDSGNPPPADIPVGDIQFYDRYRPPLEDGIYTIKIQQGVNLPGQYGSLVNPGPQLALYEHTQSFAVQGPRFRLDASDVYSVYPPANALGDYSNSVPHVVLTKRTLPWERTLPTASSAQSDDSPPWTALLLFDDDEILTAAVTPATATANPTKAQTLPLSQIVNLDINGGSILGPQNIRLDASDADAASSCLAIDIAPATFTAIAPQLAELQYLAHCREVNTGNKEILGLSADGWFSVVLGNRVPSCATIPTSQTGQATAAAATGARNIAHLVSLEGLQDYLPNGSKSIPANISKVRLVSLASWSFTCATAGLNFGQLMNSLGVDLLRMPAAQSSSAPVNSPPDQTASAGTIAVEALRHGYAPINYTTLEGERTVAWCRGPLVPYATVRLEHTPFVTSDEAMIFDPDTGLFNLSYALAWEIGRLMALADREFAVAMLNWQRETHRVIDLLMERRKLAAKFADTLEMPAAPVLLAERGLMQRLLTRYMLVGFVERVRPEEPGREPLFLSRDPTGLRERIDEMPGLLSEDELTQLLASGSDPSHGWRKKIFEYPGRDT